MSHKKIFICFLASVIALFLNYGLDPETKKDYKLLEGVHVSTGFRIDAFYEKYKMDTFEVNVAPFVKGQLCLSDEGFGSEEKKFKIKNTPTIKAHMFFSSGIITWMILAKFKTNDDAMLGYYDISGDKSDTGLKQSLLSGETIKNAMIMIYHSEFKARIEAYLVYRNCVLVLIIARKGLAKLNQEDLTFIDNLIKFIVSIIDNSY